MADVDDFDQVRRDPDPIRRGRRATTLIITYQQRAAELARLRRAAIDEAHDRKGMSYKDIAESLGLTKGRITQIRTTAPPAERAFFGVGPVSVGIPRRFGFEEGRERPYFDASDQATANTIETTLTRLALATQHFPIDSDLSEAPPGDCVIICGPKSAPIARYLLESDTDLGFDQDETGWCITDSRTGERHYSPFRRDDSDRSDLGYFSRRLDDDRVIVHIAGITSVGSAAVAHWLDTHLSDLYDPSSIFVSGIVQGDFDAEYAITASRLVAGPYSADD
ncbi:sigma-70 family RNA polymerase sigma factor [Nocardia wallacei]|uniref:sigma-70 family RNA polymerase sigma factor n=1 Tax=Nocardia wallacei TaxID=480035 RepID=UPI0024540854|nr:sigma-70 family RNA polymerase sigma factor [Nocardia wallacei]